MNCEKCGTTGATERWGFDPEHYRDLVPLGFFCDPCGVEVSTENKAKLQAWGSKFPVNEETGKIIFPKRNLPQHPRYITVTT